MYVDVVFVLETATIKDNVSIQEKFFDITIQIFFGNDRRGAIQSKGQPPLGEFFFAFSPAKSEICMTHNLTEIWL